MTSPASPDGDPARPTPRTETAGVPQTTDDTPTWTIAQIADEFGITHRTVRHYEDLGLLTPERRGTARVYRPRERIRLTLILRGRRLGFPLEEIRTIVDMYDENPGEAGQLRYLLGQIEDRRADLERRRRDVEDSLAELAELERRCHDDLAQLTDATGTPDATVERTSDPGHGLDR